MTTLCGIDPGQSGGFAWKWPGCKAVAMKMPATDGDIIKLLRHIIGGPPSQSPAPCTFYLENLLKFAGGKRPESAIAVYASNWGSLKGMIQFSNCPLHLVMGKSWQKALSLGAKGERSTTQWKNHLKAHAQRVFPHLDVTLATADALCILHYALEQNKEFTGL